MIKYISTRGGPKPQRFEKVVLSGLAPDGGLYVPETWPQLDLKALEGAPYTEIAFAVMYPFVEGCIPPAAFKNIVEQTYSPSVFRHPDIVPMKTLYPDFHLLELFHGPTIAFKDVALQLLGRLFGYFLEKNNSAATIIGATSGDTGSAAIEGCRHAGGAHIFILHPHGRVSDVQRRQMTTVEAPNVHNIALEGTFDDCQAIVKALFGDPAFRTDMNLSAVNSINWARIMAQIVYYVQAVLRLARDDVSFIVPTGNFGNVFAAYCARKMGVPMDTLYIATNKNDILTRFFETGTMEKSAVSRTISPSMDIQVSSNFERYLFDCTGRDPVQLRALMSTFHETGRFTVPGHDGVFKAFRADDAQTLETMKTVYEDTGYVLDPHTAVGVSGELSLRSNLNKPLVSLACAHPAKFPEAVHKATGVQPPLPDHLSDLFEKEERLHVLPADIDAVQSWIREQSSR